MRRVAILIEASKLKDHSDLPGARADVENFRDWLRSNPGGAWENDEIHVLSHPTEATVNAYLAAATGADYGFVAFSGHGEHVRGYYTNETRIQINDRQAYSAPKLAGNFVRATVVVDACRNVRYLRSLTANVKESRSLSFSDESYSRYRHRQLFDSQVAVAEEGVVFMYGCSLNQSANDFPNGGAFSFALATEARAWAESTRRQSMYTVLDAFTRATDIVKAAVNNQTPTMEGAIRRRYHFPFGVVA